MKFKEHLSQYLGNVRVNITRLFATLSLYIVLIVAPVITQAATPFAVGDRVQTTANLKVRATPSISGTILGTQPSRALGTLAGGPTIANGYIWWNINYDTGADGWGVQNYLTEVNPIPTVTISASPTSVSSGGSSTLTWSSMNATSCIATNGWSGTKATSGSQTITGIITTIAYNLICTGAGGSQAMIVVPVVYSAPTATLSQSATTTTSDGTTGDTFIVSWTSANAASCTLQKQNPSGVITNPWASGVSGSKSAAPPELGVHHWWIDCMGSGGTAHQDVHHTVQAKVVPPPTVTLTASPTSITSGGSSTLTWTSTNATSCTGTTAGGASGTATVSPTATQTYSIICTGAGGSSPSASATVTVTSTAALDPCPIGAVTLSSGSLTIGDCTISGNITLSGSASVHVVKGTVTVAGNVTLSNSAVFSVENSTLIFPQTNPSQYEIDLSGSSQLTFNGVTLITNGTSKNNFSMTLNARDTSAMSVSNSTLDFARSWLLGNFFNSATLTSNYDTNIPTEIYPEDFSQITLVNSTVGGMWLKFVSSSSANVTLPVVDGSGNFNFALGSSSGNNITYQVNITNSQMDLNFNSFPNSTLHLTGVRGTNPAVTIGYYITGNPSPVTVSGLTGGFIASKTLTDLGRTLSLTNVDLAPFGWQVYAQNNMGGLVTIQNSFINELGALQNSNVKVANSTLQLAVLAAAAPTSQILVDNSDIWSSVIQAINGGHITIQNSTIHGNFFTSSGCSGGNCSTITLTTNVTEANNGTQSTCTGINIFQPNGTPNCNPQNSLQAPSTFTTNGGIINR